MFLSDYQGVCPSGLWSFYVWEKLFHSLGQGLSGMTCSDCYGCCHTSQFEPLPEAGIHFWWGKFALHMFEASQRQEAPGSYISITCPLQTGTARLTSPPSVRLLKTEWCHKFHVWKRQDIMIPASNLRDSGKISTLTHQPTFYMGIAKLIRGLGMGLSALLVDMVDFGSRLCT